MKQEDKNIGLKSNIKEQIPSRYVIMVVDDDDALQLYMKKILEEHYEVLQAYTVGQALNYLQNDTVDLVLLDLMLPSVSGISLCRKIRETWKKKNLPIIVLTARTDLETKVESLEAGADDYITKPFHQQELQTRIKVQLRIKDLQKELIKTERLKAIIETAISANHEINNPLCAIINNTELIKAMPSISSNEEIVNLLDQVLTNSFRIDKTIKKMAKIIRPALSEYMPGIPMLDIEKSEADEIK